MKIFVSLSRMWDRKDPEIEEALNKAGVVLMPDGSFSAQDDEDNTRISAFFKLLKSVKFRRIRPQNTGPNEFYYVKGATTVRMTTDGGNGFSAITSITVS